MLVDSPKIGSNFMGLASGSTNSLLLEGFPESFKTGDLVNIFDKISSPTIKWTHDTSAIAVFPTSAIGISMERDTVYSLF